MDPKTVEDFSREEITTYKYKINDEARRKNLIQKFIKASSPKLHQPLEAMRNSLSALVKLLNERTDFLEPPPREHQIYGKIRSACDAHQDAIAGLCKAYISSDNVPHGLSTNKHLLAMLRETEELIGPGKHEEIKSALSVLIAGAPKRDDRKQAATIARLLKTARSKISAAQPARPATSNSTLDQTFPAPRAQNAGPSRIQPAASTSQATIEQTPAHLTAPNAGGYMFGYDPNSNLGYGAGDGLGYDTGHGSGYNAGDDIDNLYLYSNSFPSFTNSAASMSPAMEPPPAYQSYAPGVGPSSLGQHAQLHASTSAGSSRHQGYGSSQFASSNMDASPYETSPMDVSQPPYGGLDVASSPQGHAPYGTGFESSFLGYGTAPSFTNPGYAWPPTGNLGRNREFSGPAFQPPHQTMQTPFGAPMNPAQDPWQRSDISGPSDISGLPYHPSHPSVPALAPAGMQDFGMQSQGQISAAPPLTTPTSFGAPWQPTTAPSQLPYGATSSGPFPSGVYASSSTSNSTAPQSGYGPPAQQSAQQPRQSSSSLEYALGVPSGQRRHGR